MVRARFPTRVLTRSLGQEAQMGAPMSMNKAIHAALRRDLARFATALSSFPDGDALRARRLALAWQHFEHEMTRHHTGEHEIAWPALKGVGVSEETLSRMDGEHDMIAPALAAAEAAMGRLVDSPTAAEAAIADEAVRTLRTVVDEHFAHEEAELEPVYQAKSDTRELKAMGRAFGRASPPVAGKFLAWIQNGASEDELAGIRASVPAPVRVIIGGVFGRSYRRNIAPIWETD
jgi:hemerythrin-like domain-containing protein